VLFKILKHDHFAAELIEQVKDDYQKIDQNLSFYLRSKDSQILKVPEEGSFKYSRRNRPIAEIDVMGHKKNSIDVYEVKCGYRITKARKQLHKIKKILRKVYKKRINLFFYHGGSGELIQIF